MKEQELYAMILAVLRYRGIFAWRNSVGRRRGYRMGGPPGVPDILGILPGGRMLAIECKTDSGKLSPKQLDFAAAIQSAGGLWILARDLKDVELALK